MFAPRKTGLLVTAYVHREGLVFKGILGEKIISKKTFKNAC